MFFPVPEQLDPMEEREQSEPERLLLPSPLKIRWIIFFAGCPEALVLVFFG